MIGGRRTKKKAVGEKTSSRSNTVCTDVKFRMAPIAAPKHTVTMDSGKYWKCVCSMRWIIRIPKAMTHSTKKMLSELPFSSSTAFFRGAAVDVVVVELVVVKGAIVMLTLSVTLLKFTFAVVDGFETFSGLLVASTGVSASLTSDARTFPGTNKRNTQSTDIHLIIILIDAS